MPDREAAVVFPCEEKELVGIIHHGGDSDTAVVVVVGGPQYRVGSHRQFVLLARALANNGITTFRFDYRSMGDSEGDIRDFEDVAFDIKSAIDFLQSECPNIKKIVLWGLCDAASASCFYAFKDSRVIGMVLLNPWVRTESGEAKAYLKHYYLSRLVNRDMWSKVFTGRFEFRNSVKSLISMLVKLFSGNKNQKIGSSEMNTGKCSKGNLPERMLCGLSEFSGDVLLILSGDDLTADEFRDLVSSSPEWKNVLGRSSITQHTLPEANHTFSSQRWRKQVEDWTIEWIKVLS